MGLKNRLIDAGWDNEKANAACDLVEAIDAGLRMRDMTSEQIKLMDDIDSVEGY